MTTVDTALAYPVISVNLLSVNQATTPAKTMVIPNPIAASQKAYLMWVCSVVGAVVVAALAASGALGAAVPTGNVVADCVIVSPVLMDANNCFGK